MFFKKKDDTGKLPDLPSLPASDSGLGKLEKINVRKPIEDNLEEESLSEKEVLPDFPDSPSSDSFDSPAKGGFFHADVKESANESELPELPWGEEKEEDKKKFKTVESDEGYQSSSLIEVPKKEIAMGRNGKLEGKNQDIYVKLDKFRAGKKSLAETKMRLEEIENLLKKIRETKMREEQELAGWEGEINAIKGKLKDVTENIFEKSE